MQPDNAARAGAGEKGQRSARRLEHTIRMATSKWRSGRIRTPPGDGLGTDKRPAGNNYFHEVPLADLNCISSESWRRSTNCVLD
jgi:hypothetical protein